MTAYAALTLSHSESVAEIQLSRPDVVNRFDSTLTRELRTALLELRDDPAVLAVVLSSTGKHFSAGGDFKSMLAANADHNVLMRQVDEGRDLFRAFADFPKPLVVAVQGDVFGLGASLVLTADAVVATASGRIVDPHVRMGLVAGDGGAVSWPVNLPFIRAKRQLLWGEPLTGKQAHELGIVTELADSAEQVRLVALDLAARVAALPPVAVQLTKRTLNKYLHSRIDDVFDAGMYLEAISARTSDVAEAVSAFKEKREGRWTGA
ncbi:enoyl-CoA hydratase/isomerase family protein [Amycolatopsis sp. K13G38]|uniref:Enoyl-CoA hydratase/isomerase family protein n=1 Tax=Amycolatopsis acididurans TaxID=2724524 RepID=A0ABX1JB92_9PSEU|nr:enoyl-CoA hydratase/isomerase family protein [Amycolatopsis acididurans]NKQ57058.1 enoyl-CoA hydratase/isomerase family protein [Amycolatopsis acididurans]